MKHASSSSLGINLDSSEELFYHAKDPHEFDSLARDRNFNSVLESLTVGLPKIWLESLGGSKG